MATETTGPEPGAFARATAVERVDNGDSDGDTDGGQYGGRYRSAIAPGWDIGGNANGGYLLAIAARAMADAAGRPDPVTITAHYLSPGKPGPLAIDCLVPKRGRRFATVSAQVRSGDGRPVLAVLGSFGDLGVDASAVPELVGASPPELPPPDRCPRSGLDDAFASAFRAKLDVRLHPDDAVFLDGAPTGDPLVRGWFRLPDGEPVDAVGLLLAVDAFPPTAFNARLPVAWTPTVELTAHVRVRPRPGWLRCVFRTRFVTGGFLEEDGEVWDDGGRLVAQSRQLALVPKPGSGW